ncbi:MAG: N-acetylmuramoyl-L-alanine amidase, partial [Pseudomonadota bacterium]
MPAPLVMLDPGHGGIDPGAVRAGVAEKDVALAFGLVLADEMRAAGLRVAMTREEDVFVPLSARVSAARAIEADVFVSLHANTVAQGVASGATVYILSAVPSDADAAAVAEFENSAERLAGYDAVNGEDVCDASATAMAVTSPAEKLSGGRVCAVSRAYPPRR